MATGVIEMDEVITPTVHADGTEVNQDGVKIRLMIRMTTSMQRYIAIPRRAIRV
jgi:hypothetical protein